MNTLLLARYDDLENIRDEWNDLLERSGNATIFQTPEWILPLMRHATVRRPSAIAVRRAGRLIALAPLETTPLQMMPALRRLQFVVSSASDYNDVVLERSDTGSALDSVAAVWEELTASGLGIDLHQIPASSPTLTWWSGRPRNSLDGRVVDGRPCYVTRLPSTWEEFQRKLGKKMRSNIGYYERLIRRNYDTHLSILGPEELDEGLAALYRLHTRRWNSRGRSGIYADQRARALHREVASLFAGRNWLRFYSLRLNGEIQALLLCFAYRRTLYYYQGGFEPSLTQYSPGTVLTAYAIRDAITNGCENFNFLRGDESYKRRWTAEAEGTRRLLLWGRPARSRLAGKILGLTDDATRLGRRFRAYLRS
jgi:CelD/BcsL family acetyltransferase involved in cellulose biosynthesis